MRYRAQIANTDADNEWHPFTFPASGHHERQASSQQQMYSRDHIDMTRIYFLVSLVTQPPSAYGVVPCQRMHSIHAKLFRRMTMMSMTGVHPRDHIGESLMNKLTAAHLKAGAM